MRTIIFLSMLLIGAVDVSASQKTQIEQGNKLFRAHEWEGALEHYLNALEYPTHADIVRYNLAGAFYKKGNYDQAIEHLSKVIAHKDSPLLAKAQYNTGNAFYKKALASEKRDIEEAIRSMEKAVENYQQTLILKPKDEDARFNRTRAQDELERLKKNKEEQDKQNKQNKQQDKGSSSDKSKKEQQEPSAQDKSSRDKQEAPLNDAQGQDGKNDAGADGQRQKEDPGSTADDAQGQPPLLKEEQARDMLDTYERQEEPRGIIHFVNRHQGESHVERDW